MSETSEPSDGGFFEDYLSKSRLKTWVNCNRMYFYKYIEKRDEPETEAMIRGTNVHDIIETYYENVQEYVSEHGEIPDSLYSMLPHDKDAVNEYLDPYISHFLGFERRRLESADGNLDDWVAVAVEEEMWKELFDDTPELMGHADVMLPAASFSNEAVPTDEGVVLVDHKTGEPKSERYRDHENAGVNLDLSYYALLFESDYDITYVGAYYPKTDDFFTTSLQEERRQFIEEVAQDIASADPDNIEDYPINMNPLCAWGTDDGERCTFYDDCDSTWAVPIDEKDRTIELLKDGYNNSEIADELGTTEDAVSYWVRNERLHRFRAD